MQPRANHLHRQTCLCIATIVLLSGCRFVQGIDLSQLAFPNFADPAQVAPATASVPNPLVVPVNDPEFVWNQIVDMVDDYFEIQSERRVQLVGGVLTEGNIRTHSTPGATLLEPWRWDSTPRFRKTTRDDPVDSPTSHRTCRAAWQPLRNPSIRRKRARRRRPTGARNARIRIATT